MYAYKLADPELWKYHRVTATLSELKLAVSTMLQAIITHCNNCPANVVYNIFLSLNEYTKSSYNILINLLFVRLLARLTANVA